MPMDGRQDKPSPTGSLKGLQLRSEEVDRYTQLSQRAGELIEDGVNLVAEPPSTFIPSSARCGLT
jgi:hypothetical protein